MTDDTTVLGSRYIDAVAYAANVHASQTRKGTRIPYLCHLLGASALVIEAGGDEDVAIAALLHDVAEDHGGEARLTEIASLFGDRVSHIVRGCSDSITDDPDTKNGWSVRKRKHLQHLETADADVLLVTAADKLHNARAIWTDLQSDGIDTIARFNGRPRDLTWYYQQVLRILVKREVSLILTLPLAEVVVQIASVLVPADGEPAASTRQAAAGVGRNTWFRGDDELFDEPVQRTVLGRDLTASERWLAPGTRDPDIGGWSLLTAQEILRQGPFAVAEIVTCGVRWELRIFEGPWSGFIVGFRSDGSWTEATRTGRWSGVLEGGPDALARSVVSAYRRTEPPGPWLLTDISVLKTALRSGYGG